MTNNNERDLNKIQPGSKKNTKGAPAWIYMLAPIWIIIIFALVIGIMILFNFSPGN